jgi:hypothetical protein
MISREAGRQVDLDYPLSNPDQDSVSSASSVRDKSSVSGISVNRAKRAVNMKLKGVHRQGNRGFLIFQVPGIAWKSSLR